MPELDQLFGVKTKDAGQTVVLICPDREALRDFADGRLQEDESQRVGQHVNACFSCQDFLDHRNVQEGRMLLNNRLLPRGQTSEKSPADSEHPRVLGEYELGERLGSGGMGTVYEARHRLLDKRVAVKLMSLGPHAGQQALDRFRREMKAAGSLEHPHLVQAHDAGEFDGVLYLVLEYIEGTDLQRFVEQRGPLPVAQACELVRQAALGLQYLFERGLVHRDVKPGNLMRTSSGDVKLLDLGLARWRSGAAPDELTRSGAAMGTPDYMAPEQIGDASGSDIRADLYGLGGTLFFLLAGRAPFFHHSQLAEKFDAHRQEEPPDVRALRRDVPEAVASLVNRLLAKRPEDRFDTPQDLADELAQRTGSGNQPASSAGDAPGPPRVVPKGLRSFDEEDQEFFLGLLPGPHREGLPECLHFWKSRLEETSPGKSFRIGLLYGPSGCGKSSLVKAGLIPRLDQDLLIPIYVAAHDCRVESCITAAVRRAVPDLPAKLGLADLLGRIPRKRSLAGRKVVLFIDQFEQWLHAHRGETNTELSRALSHCDGERLQCVLMVRAEFWVAVSRFKDELGVDWKTSENALLADLFDQFHARKVLAEFGRGYGRLPDDLSKLTRRQREFLRQAIEQLADDDGRVVSVHLALLAQMLQGQDWLPETLEQVGGIAGVGVTFLDRQFNPPTANPLHLRHRRAAVQVLSALLPDLGSEIKGGRQSEHALRHAAKYDERPDEFRQLLDILDNQLRLITPTDQEHSAQSAGHEKYYQLTHDYLVPALREWLTCEQRATRRGRAEVCLEERNSLWQHRRENRHLPTWWEYFRIRLWTNKTAWTQPQREMMRQAGKLHLRRGLLLGGVAALFGWYGYERYQRFRRSLAQAALEDLLEADSDAVQTLLRALEPHYRWLDADALAEAATSDSSGDRQRLNASLVLLRFEGRQMDYLLERLLDAGPREFDLLREELQQRASVEQLHELWRKLEREAVETQDATSAKQTGSSIEEDREELAQRRANLAAAMLHWDQPRRVWPLLKHSADPRLRSYLIHRCASLKADARLLIDALLNGRLRQEVSIRRALILSIGEYPAEDTPADRRAELDAALQSWATGPDPGLCAAAEWTLRQRGQNVKATSQAMDERRIQTLAASLQRGRPQWYATRTFVVRRDDQRREEDIVHPGQRMVCIAGRVPFRMGTPNWVEERMPNETPHIRFIPRRFAIAAKETNVAQFQAFHDWQMERGHSFPFHFNSAYAPDMDCPQTQATWYFAAAYCNWLSMQEGIAPDQWCFLNAQGEPARGIEEFNEGMKLPKDYLQRTGYRLPTEAEWEFAARAGAGTNRYYGQSAALLEKYACYRQNVRFNKGTPRTEPVGSFKPNDFGLFDMHGNVLEWCQEVYRPNHARTEVKMMPVDGKTVEVVMDVEDDAVETVKGVPVENLVLKNGEGGARSQRGGAMDLEAGRVRSGDRDFNPPEHYINNSGFRVARTLPVAGG